jgi:hypothetical protein
VIAEDTVSWDALAPHNPSTRQIIGAERVLDAYQSPEKLANEALALDGISGSRDKSPLSAPGAWHEAF